MKIDNKLFAFIFIYMIFQYIFGTLEANEYFDMISDIQKYKYNVFKNGKNQFTFKNIIIYCLIYLWLPIILYFFIIHPHKSYIEGFCLSLSLFSCDLALFSFFDTATLHYKVLLFDVFIVGGAGMLLSQYIIYNYYNIIKYTLFLFILYILSMIIFMYTLYKYNPDLSNITGYSLI